MLKIARLANLVFSGLRFRLLLLVALACAPLVALTLHTAWEDRRRARNNWRQRAEHMMQAASQEEEDLISESRQLLLALADSPPVRNGNRPGCQKLVDQYFISHQRYANVGVTGTNADIVASAVPIGAKLTAAETELCKRAMETGAFLVGDFPARRAHGKPVFNFAYPIVDANGATRGAVFAALDLSWFNRFGSGLPAQLPRNATWTEVDRKGTILIRYPSPRTWVGQPFPEMTVLKTIWGKREGVLEAENSVGVPTFYAFAGMQSQLTSGETAGILSIPKQVLFATADRALLTSLGWLGLAALVAVLFGWVGSDFLIVRPVKSLVQSSARLAAGDLSVRTGLRYGRDELGRLMYAFDQMAQSLEHREEDRRRAGQKLQVMSQRLVEVQESERRHIARELHDEIGQSLTVAEMNLQAALQCSEQGGITRRLEESIEAVERVLEQVHDLSLNLRPSMLDDLGLEPALRWYTNRQASAGGIHARFRAEPLEHRLESIIETGCFRVAQEALTNVVRHSKARQVTVELKQLDGQLHLSVKDDGRGFDVSALRDQAMRGASLGLLSMEERASLAGGGLQFISAPGRGTDVRAWFPLRWKAEVS